MEVLLIFAILICENVFGALLFPLPARVHVRAYAENGVICFWVVHTGMVCCVVVKPPLSHRRRARSREYGAVFSALRLQ